MRIYGILLLNASINLIAPIIRIKNYNFYYIFSVILNWRKSCRLSSQDRHSELVSGSTYCHYKIIMMLFNKTKNKTITSNLKLAKTFSDNLFGLLKEKENTAMLFNTRFGIHTFFMKYPITIIILNKNYKVVKIKKNLQPYSFFFWNPKYSKIIELTN